MKLQRHWLIALIVLAAVWSAVAIVNHLTDEHIVTAEKVLNLLRSSPWMAEAKASPLARSQHIDLVAGQMAKLTFEQRRELRDEGEEVMKAFFDSLTQEERKNYVDRTVQPHFDAVMKGLKAMSAEERRQTMGRFRREAKPFLDSQVKGSEAAASGSVTESASAETKPKNEGDQKLMDEFADIGFEEYFKEATTEEKMKLAPIIEDMHTRIRGARR